MLVQSYVDIPPETSRRKKVVVDETLPQGRLAQIIIRMLSGNGKLTHFRIRHKKRVLYPVQKGDVLSVRGYKDITPGNYPLLEDSNLVQMEGYNHDENEITRLKVDFVLLPNPADSGDSTMRNGG